MTDSTADPAPALDVTVAHQARVYDYWLGARVLAPDSGEQVPACCGLARKA